MATNVTSDETEEYAEFKKTNVFWGPIVIYSTQCTAK
jgi:hypothetical protein